MAVCVRTGSAGITGAWMSMALALTRVDTSKVIFDIAGFSMIDLERNNTAPLAISNRRTLHDNRSRRSSREETSQRELHGDAKVLRYSMMTVTL